MSNYSIVKVHGREHVVKKATQRYGSYSLTDGGVIPESNYLLKNLALCGVLEKGETLEEWEQAKKMRTK